MINTYTDAGQLMCILCKSIVRNETVWPVHVNSKTHKENIIQAKKTKLETDSTKIQVHKRSSSPSQESSTNKKIKSILKNSTQSAQIPSNLSSNLFDNPSKEANNTKLSNNSVITTRLENDKEFVVEKDIKNIEVEEEKEKEKNKDTNQQSLPEGFFDDPILDAKVRILLYKIYIIINIISNYMNFFLQILQVRNVEYKNPIEEEWEKFQKEIKEETAQSAQIIADDQEEATTERQLDEIEEQIRHWSR